MLLKLWCKGKNFYDKGQGINAEPLTEQGTAIAGAALPKRDILIVESYVTIAFVEDVVSFKRNRETILAESLVKLGIEARGRTELHVLLVSTAVPFKLFIKVNDL